MSYRWWASCILHICIYIIYIYIYIYIYTYIIYILFFGDLTKITFGDLIQLLYTKRPCNGFTDNCLSYIT